MRRPGQWMGIALVTLVATGVGSGSHPGTSATQELSSPPAAGVRSGPADLLAHLDMLRERYKNALVAGDIDGLAGLWAERGMALPPGSPALHGRAAIESWYRAFLSSHRVELQARTVDLVARDDWSYRLGTYELRTVPRHGGEASREVGKFLEVWRRTEDGRWRIFRDIWNADG